MLAGGRAALVVACAVAAVGCGSAAPEELPPAAEPERSPPLRERPAGRVVPVGDAPEGPYPHDAVRAGGLLFVADEHDDTLRAIRSGRAVSRVATALGPTSPAVAEEGERVAVVAARERVLELFDARTMRRIDSAPAGVGPTNVVSDGGSLLYVVDTEGDGLLLFRTRPRLELERRVALAGGPYAIAIDRVRRRLWVTVTGRNRLVELTAN